MALEKSVEVAKTGNFASYFIISTMTIDYTKEVTLVSMIGFKDADIKDIDGDHIVRAGVDFTFDGFPDTLDPREWAYAKIKNRVEWEDAIDV